MGPLEQYLVDQIARACTHISNPMKELTAPSGILGAFHSAPDADPVSAKLPRKDGDVYDASARLKQAFLAIYPHPNPGS
ncbi:hypothetical protein NDU88_004748 [Pleurodeles waltl]|uniref:Uncharacterized protein n=1 Tax=Pleurodeles waltl TaxID=8319 RepID=A0AAV7V216_PLEWA|nr:hypothetical protein NDU88_004748 [Pleurodeles waltl]